MKYLVIGDTHCRVKYLDDYKAMANAVLNVATERREDFDAIVLLGDDFHHHGRADVITFNTVYEFLTLLSEIHPVIKLIGNHELPSPLHALSHYHFFKATNKRIEIVDSISTIGRGDDTVLFVPFCKREALEAWISENEERVRDAKCAFGHIDIKGAMFTGMEDDSIDWVTPLPYMVSGHIHQKIQGENFLYVGTPYQTTFAEDEDKYIHIVNSEDPKNNTESILLEGLIKYRTLTLKASCKKLPVFEKGVKYRVKLEGTIDELIKFKRSVRGKELQDRKAKIVPVVEQGDSPELSKVERRTFMDIMETDLNDELKPLWKEVKDACNN